MLNIVFITLLFTQVSFSGLSECHLFPMFLCRCLFLLYLSNFILDSVFLEYSHRFMYISRFITLSDIYFCVLSLKELWRNVRCAGNFIYAFYVPKLC